MNASSRVLRAPELCTCVRADRSGDEFYTWWRVSLERGRLQRESGDGQLRLEQSNVLRIDMARHNLKVLL